MQPLIQYNDPFVEEYRTSTNNSYFDLIYNSSYENFQYLDNFNKCVNSLKFETLIASIKPFWKINHSIPKFQYKC